MNYRKPTSTSNMSFFSSLFDYQAFLGGAAASLALIIASPFSDVKEFKLPDAPKPVAKPEVTKTVKVKKVVEEVKKESKAPAAPATGGLAVRTFAKKAAVEAKIAEAKVSVVNDNDDSSAEAELLHVSSSFFPLLYGRLTLQRA